MRPDAARAGRDQRRAQLELDRIREREAEKAREKAKAARALVFANEELVRLAEQERETLGVTGVALEHMKLQHERMNALLRARETMTDTQLAAYKDAIDNEMSIRVQIIATNEALKQQAKIRDEILEKQKKEEENARKAAEDAEEYAKDMSAIWREGIGKIVTDGTKSFADFFENVLRMFSKLMAQMEDYAEKTGKMANPGMYKALGVGSIAIAGGFTGYEIGRGTTNRAMGALGGAASGAMAGATMGSAIPGIGTAAGAALGGITGFIGGLIGAGEAAVEASNRMRELQKALSITLEGFRASDRGDDLEIAIADERAKFFALRNQIGEAYGQGSERLRLLIEADEMEARAIERLQQKAALLRQQASEDLEVRALVAQGRNKEADAMRLQLAQARELAEAERAGMDAVFLARLREVHALEAIKAATDAVTRSQLNMVQGYRLQAAIFGAMTPRERGGGRIAPPTAPRIHPEDPNPPQLGPGGDVPVTLVLQDGTSLGNAVLKNFHAQAQRTFGDSSRWAELN